MEVALIIAIFSAALQTVQLWLQDRESTKASRRAKYAFTRTYKAKLAKTQANRLSRLLPPAILKAMGARVQRCWDIYEEVIAPDSGRMPREIDEATEALKRCLCEELERIRVLNGSIPAGKLREWWELFCAE